VITDDHILALEIAVYDAAIVGEGHGVADADEVAEQLQKVRRHEIVDRLVAPGMEVVDDFGERATLQEAHGVEAARAVFGRDVVVDRDHAGVIELPGDLRLASEPGAVVVQLGLLVLEALERDLAAEHVIEGAPDLADATGRM